MAVMKEGRSLERLRNWSIGKTARRSRYVLPLSEARRAQELIQPYHTRGKIALKLSIKSGKKGNNMSSVAFTRLLV